MITPRVDKEDKAFGFAYKWILKLAEKVDKLYIITLRKSSYSLPKNVKIFDVGSKNKFLKVLKFYKYFWQIFDKTDVIFCHMYLEFTFLVYPLAKLFKKPIVTWYTHRAINFRLKLVKLMVNRIVTVNKDTCRLKSKKIIPVGHGTNTDFFKPVQKKKRKIKLLLTLGRISPIKNIEDMIIVMKSLKDCKLLVVGDAPERDKTYLIHLKNLVKELKLNNVEFHRGVNFSATLNYYQNADLFIHTCSSGLDKASLEAMSCGLPLIACSNAHKEILKDYPVCIFKEHNIEELNNKIKTMLKMSYEDRTKLGLKLRNIIINNHSVNTVVNNLVKVFEEKWKSIHYKSARKLMKKRKL